MSPKEIERVKGHCIVQSTVPDACVSVTDAKVYKWLRERGRASYASLLMRHVGATLADPIRNADELFGHRLRADYFSRYRFVVANWAENVFFARNQRVLLLETVASGIIGIVLLLKRRSKLVVVSVAVLVSTYPHMFVAWTFDALETQRHALGASVLLRLVILVLFLAAIASFSCVAPIESGLVDSGGQPKSLA